MWFQKHLESRRLRMHEKRYPCFRWNSDPCYIHVVVQQVEFGLQRQDETVEKHVSTINSWHLPNVFPKRDGMHSGLMLLYNTWTNLSQKPISRGNASMVIWSRNIEHLFSVYLHCSYSNVSEEKLTSWPARMWNRNPYTNSERVLLL